MSIFSTCVLRDKFERITRKNTAGNTNVLTISAQHGLINQFEYYNNQYASEDTSGYTLLRKGEFAYNKSYSEGYPLGATKKLERYESGIVSPLYICFAAKTGVCVDFYSYYFESEPFYREIYKIAQEGARNHGLLNVPAEDFFQIKIADPPLDEQKRIAEMLGCCDRGIALKKELIAEKKRQKKALMQKLLDPDSGVRLPGFSAEWKQVRIADVADLLTGYPFESEQFSSSGIKLLRCSNVKRGVLDWDPLITVYWQSAKGVEEFQLRSGDIVIAMDGALAGYSFAKIACEDLPLLLVQRVARLRATKIHQDYLAHCVINSTFGEYITRVKTDTAIPHMSAKDILGYTFYMPASNEEQQAIADILSAADKEIDLLEYELTQQQQKKKSLMQLLLTGIVRV